MRSSSENPHQNQPVREVGASPDEARAAVVLVHGRGATARSMMPLAGEIDLPDVHYRVPQAAGRTWYPNSFLMPLQQNEPHLSSALQAVGGVLAALEDDGFPAKKTVLLGFSQGACLSLEYAARHPKRYGGVVAFSGGLIGAGEQDGDPPEDKAFDYAGSLSDTPVFVGCSDRDPHVPPRRIEQTEAAMERLGARLTLRLYEGMGHTINQDEVTFARGLLQSL